MLTAFFCTQGHSWEPDVPSEAICASAMLVCPECGSPALEESYPTQSRKALPNPSLDTPSIPVVSSRAFYPQLPDYEILEELGRGGMGVVYKARHRTLNRIVAVKMILAGDCAGAEDRARFLIEAEAVAQLQHPNIVQLYENGEHRGRPFFALEYVSGPSLARRLQEKPLSPLEAVAILEPIARAIHHAHERGILHRDLKPGNILISDGVGSSSPRPTELPPLDSAPHPILRDVRSAVPKVADFGLAKQLFAGHDLTASGMAIGTPNYMAPENALGNAKQMGLRSDIFSLGAILYEMLTGKPPFVGDTPVLTMMKVVHDEPEPISRLQPRVPRDLTTICYRCLEKDPARRYPSAKALAEELNRFQQGKAIEARPVGQLEYAWKWAKRRPAPAALIVLFVLIGLFGVPGFALLWLRADHARNLEADARRDAVEMGRHEQQAREQERQAREQAEWKVYYSRIALARNEHQQNRIGDSNNQLELCDPKKRGWEWDMLLARNHADLMTVPIAFSSHVFDLAFSPDGTMLMAAGGDVYSSRSPGRTRVWSFPGGEEVAHSPSFDAVHRGVGWMPDGRSAFITSNSNRIYRWDLKQKKTSYFHSIPGKDNAFLAVSPDGSQLLATAHESNQFQMWDTATGAKAYVGNGTRGSEYPAFSRDGKYFAFDGEDSAFIYHASTGKLWKQILHAGSRPQFHPSGKYLVTMRGPAMIWNLETGQLERSLGGEEGSVKSAAFSPDGQHLATAGADGTVRLWNLDGGMVVTTYRGHRGRVNCVCFHPSGRYLASGGEQPADIKVWDLTRNPESNTLFHHGLGGEAQAIAFDPSGERVRIAAKGGHLLTRSVTAGRIENHFRIDKMGTWLTPATQAAFSPDAGRLATLGDRESVVHLYDTATGTELRTLSTGGRGGLFQVHWSGDGRRVVGTRREPPAPKQSHPTLERTLYVWDAETGKTLASYRTEMLRLRRLHGDGALNGDGTLLAYDETIFDGDDQQVVRQAIRIRAIGTGEIVRDIPLESDTIVSALRFAPDGQTLAVSSRDNLIRLWNVRSGEPLFEQPFRGPGTVLAFRPDGSQLAGVDREQVKVWDLQAGVEALDLRGARPRTGDGGFNPQLAWGADGRRLAISNHQNDVSVWIAQPQDSTEGKARLYETAEARSVAWNLRGADSALRNGNEFSLSFHLDQLRGKELRDELESQILRNIHLHRADWAKAYDVWKAAVPKDSRFDPEDEAQFSLLGLLVQDRITYPRMAKNLSAEFDRLPGSSKSLVGLALVVSPEPIASHEGWARIAAMPESTYPPQAYWDQAMRGLAYYRAGQYREAASSMERARKKHPRLDGEIWRDFALAMTYHRLERHAEAKQCWERGRKSMVELRRNLPSNATIGIPNRWEWWEWAVMELMEREASALFQSEMPTAR